MRRCNLYQLTFLNEDKYTFYANRTIDNNLKFNANISYYKNLYNVKYTVRYQNVLLSFEIIH